MSGKYATRPGLQRDANEGPLIKEARKLGWYFVQLNAPADWLGCVMGKWFPIEIKSAEGILTKKQEDFHMDCIQWRMPICLWRSIEDVTEQTNNIKAGRPPR